MLLASEPVTTSIPGRTALARCIQCRGVLLATRARLPRIWAGEDLACCDDCIPAALAAAGTPPADHHEPTPGEDQ